MVLTNDTTASATDTSVPDSTTQSTSNKSVAVAATVALPPTINRRTSNIVGVNLLSAMSSLHVERQKFAGSAAASTLPVRRNRGSLNQNRQKKNVQQIDTDDRTQPDYTYRIHLKGESKDRTKLVEWSSKFSRPLEQLIYPSLQSEHTSSSSSSSSSSNSSALFHQEVPTWELSLKDNRRYYDELLDKSSILNEVHIDGGNILTKKIKKSYIERDRMEKEILRKAISESDALSNIVKIKKSDKRKTVNQGDDHSQADKLYYSMKKNSSVSSTKGRKLNELSDEEIYLQKQTFIINQHLSSDSIHHINALLHYRCSNTLSMKDNQQDTHINIDDTTNQYPLSSLDGGDSLSLLDDDSTSIFNGHIDAERVGDGDSSYGYKTDNNYIKDKNLSRIRQALRSRYMGYDLRDDIIDDPFYNHETNDIGTSSNSYMGTSMQSNSSLRLAQESLLLNQLDAGVIPETFLNGKSSTKLSLGDYGIGDVYGKCLGKCLHLYDTLTYVCLRDNRLTGESINIILPNLPVHCLKYLDLSMNPIGKGNGIPGVLHLVQTTSNTLQHLNVSKCSLTCTDFHAICRAIITGSCTIETLVAAGNHISYDGCIGLEDLLMSTKCSLKSLDLSWNNVKTPGAVSIANALIHNKTLTSLNLSTNQITDQGAQKLAASLAFNTSMKELHLPQNIVKGQACFVFSKVLRNHTSMERLDLSSNPVGDAGARALFKSILRGLKCFVMMRSCTYQVDTDVFNHSNPALDSPYTLDLSEPYKESVFHELVTLATESPSTCRFDGITYKPEGGVTASPQQIHTVVVDGVVCNKATMKPWVLPTTGHITCHFTYLISVPTLAMAIDPKALNILELIIIYARSDIDRRQWIKLLMKDVYVTTKQIQDMINKFIDKKVIFPAGITKLDIFTSIWDRILDSENKFDFLHDNLDIVGRKSLLFALTFECFKFSWDNPTAHWRIDLGQPDQRSLMMQIIAINNKESEYSQQHAHRNDTSQKGNWNNFRNEFRHDDKQKIEMTMDKDFFDHLPTVGIIEFDYVSTTRPNTRHKNISGGGVGDDPNSINDITIATDTDTTTAAIAITTTTASSAYPSPISEDDFYTFLDKVGLSTRTKVLRVESLYILTEMQVASGKYYLTCLQVTQIIDCFEEDTTIQSRISVLFFSRLWDLHNFDVIMRRISKKAQADVVSRLGWLNVFNPLKPSFEYAINLKFTDGRVMLTLLLELGSLENGEQIREDPRTDVLLVSLYGSLHRVLNDVRDETVRFYYYELGERSNTISWNGRRDLLSKFLVGTAPIDRSTFDIIKKHKEMEAAGTLSMGPIDLQYNSHLRKLKK